jgi:amine acid ABC transporter, permease protein, 3-TM region, His/Glu/Gln/Arg/opine family
MNLSFEYIKMLLPSLATGTLETLKVFTLTLVLALPIGLPISLGSMSRFLPLRWLCRGYTWVFRGTPLMLQLFFFYYGLGFIGNNYGIGFLVLDRFPAVIITFVLNYAAYFAEIYRGGIESIDYGQYEAAKTLGFTRWQTMRMIIIPQTIKRILPPVSNEAITLVKDTALTMVISLPELMKAARDAANRDVDTTAYLLAAIVYLTLTLILTLVSNKLEKRFSRFEAKGDA